jgi:hypothetical protein
LLRDGRDQSASVVRLVGKSGPTLVTSDQDFRHRPIIEFFANRFNLPVTYVPSGEICTQQPQWLVSTSVGADMPEVLDASVLGCNKVFKKQTSFPRWGLSGLPWTVYRLME